MKKNDRLWRVLLDAAETGRDLNSLKKDLWEQFGETCAVLALDATGFSRITQKRGIVFYLSILACLRKIGAEVFERHKAINWRAEADNLYADFESVDQAVAAAFEIHHRLDEERLAIDEDEYFQACIGIGFGRVLRSEHEGMYGDEMNLASKLGEDTARGGETLLTGSAYHSLSNKENLSAEKRQIRISAIDLPYYQVNPAPDQGRAT